MSSFIENNYLLHDLIMAKYRENHAALVNIESALMSRELPRYTQKYLTRCLINLHEELIRLRTILINLQ
jgi:hypothetical protein